MAVSNEGIKTFIAAEALVARRAVTINSSGQAAYTGVGAKPDGIVLFDTASGDPATVHMHNHPGTIPLMVVNAITKGNLVYSAASGKGSATSVGRPWYKALETSTTDGDIIEVIPLEASTQGAALVTEAHTASDTLTVGESGSIHTTFGAAGAVTFTLPPAVVGLHYYFQVGAAQNLIIEPDAAETVSLPSNGVAQANITANAVGESVFIMCCNAGTWAVMGYTGTWT
jgi:hypothetical protein